MHGLVTLQWADGSYEFRLGYAQWLELDETFEIGPLVHFDRLLRRTWRAREIREIIRVGLIGGGCNPVKALSLVARYVEDRPLTESVPIALRILEAALIVPKGARKPGKAEAAQEIDATSASTSEPPLETLQ